MIGISSIIIDNIKNILSLHNFLSTDQVLFLNFFKQINWSILKLALEHLAKCSNH